METLDFLQAFKIALTLPTFLLFGSIAFIGGMMANKRGIFN